MTDILTPKNEVDAANLIRDKFESGSKLSIEGGGTKRDLFETADGCPIISSKAITGITSYNPAELVISALAGTPLSEIESTLAENNQRFTFEPMDYSGLMMDGGEATIGAVAAMNNSGPRRIVAGAARDSLLGVRFINGTGEIVKNGGRVMKNVTGLDLVKLFAGSHGKLGLLTEVTFKVLPTTKTEITLAIRGLEDEGACSALAHAMATSTEVSGAAHLPEGITSRVAGGELGSEPATVMRIEGFTASVAQRIELLKTLFSGVAELQEIEEAQSRDLWRDIREVVPFAGNETPLWRISVAPSKGHDVALAIRMQAPGEVYYDWQGGLIWLQMLDGVYDDVVRSFVSKAGGHATLVRADETIRSSVPIFQPLTPAVEALTSRIKGAFDPKGIFQSGSAAAEAA